MISCAGFSRAPSTRFTSVDPFRTTNVGKLETPSSGDTSRDSFSSTTATLRSYRKQIERDCAEFHDLNNLQDAELAVRVNALQLHVLYVARWLRGSW